MVARVVNGVLIAESVRPGQKLDGLVMTTFERWENPAPAAGQPSVWTILRFESTCDADELAEMFSDVLDAPGWYVDFESDGQKFVVYPGKIFTYAAGDASGRAEAIAYGKLAEVPDDQLDWGE